MTNEECRTMINKKPSSGFSGMKILIILPVVAFITYTSATPEYKYVSSYSGAKIIEQDSNRKAKGIQKSIDDFQAYQGINADDPLQRVDVMPQYPGGEKAMLDFIKDNIKYPKLALSERIEGKVIVRFIVTKEGKPEQISILKGIHPLLDAEAIRVTGLLKGWEPGKLNGKAVNVWEMIPVTFELPKKSL